MKKITHAFTVLELLLALFLSGLLCSAIIGLFGTFEHLYVREISVVDFNANMRFLTIFLRRHIEEAGNASCVHTQISSTQPIVRVYDATDALSQFDLKIKSNTQLLVINECVKFHDAEHYLPLLFFVADTNRRDTKGNVEDALFMKIDQHRREELITDVIDFQPRLHMKYVEIAYLLYSPIFQRQYPQWYWFQGEQKTANKRGFYQSGRIDAVMRNLIA